MPGTWYLVRVLMVYTTRNVVYHPPPGVYHTGVEIFQIPKQPLDVLPGYVAYHTPCGVMPRPMYGIQANMILVPCCNLSAPPIYGIPSAYPNPAEIYHPTQKHLLPLQNI